MKNYGYIIPVKSQQKKAIRFILDVLKKDVLVYRLLSQENENLNGTFFIPNVSHQSFCVQIPNSHNISNLIEIADTNNIEYIKLERHLNINSLCLSIPKIGLYCGEGTDIYWLYFPPLFRDFGIDFDILYQSDICYETLSKYDVFIVPGGDSIRILLTFGNKGYKAIERYVREGGAYIGICAGGIIATKTQYHMPLTGCEALNWQIGYGRVVIKNENQEHPVMLGYPKIFDMSYENGPFFGPMNDGETLATYFKFANNFEKRIPDEDYKRVIGSGAIIYTKYGKGQVLCFGPHPENPNCPKTHLMVFNAIFYLTSKISKIKIPFKGETLIMLVNSIKQYVNDFEKYLTDFEFNANNFEDIEFTLTRKRLLKKLKKDLDEINSQISYLEKVKNNLLDKIAISSELKDETIKIVKFKINFILKNLPNILSIFERLKDQFIVANNFIMEIQNKKYEYDTCINERKRNLLKQKLEHLENSLNNRFINSIILHETNKHIIPEMARILKKLIMENHYNID